MPVQVNCPIWLRFLQLAEHRKKGVVNMPYQIDQIEDNTIIVVSYHGGVTYQQRLDAVEEVCSMIEHQPVLLLIDVRHIENLMSVKQQQQFGQYLAAREELKTAKVAVLTPENQHDPNTIINNVAYQKGYHLVPFTCRTEAIGWLEGHFA